MTYRILLGVPTTDVGADVEALCQESGSVEVARTVLSSRDLLEALDGAMADAVLLHAELGPLPPLDLAREITARHPEMGVVLMAREHTPELLRAALQSGVRGVVTLPLSLEELSTTVEGAAAWAQAVRRRLASDLEEVERDAGAGRMVVLAAAKGGVGTTTVAVHLALTTQLAGRARSVCLVDLDLQTGDVRHFLDLTHRRSIMDLVDVADDLSARHLDDALYHHASGIRILLPPVSGEHGEDITGRSTRQILGAITSRFDVVIVDVGSVMTEAAAVATEMANQVVVLTQPDVPALRGANRLLELWERLQIRKDGIAILLNRASKESEVQPDLVTKVVGMPVLKTTIPAGFRSLEAASNTGEPSRLADGPVRRGFHELATELRLAPRQSGRRQRGQGETGQVAVETIGMAAMIMFVFLLLCQVGLVGYTFLLTSHAAREGARELAVGGDADGAALENVPERWVELSGQARDLTIVDVGERRVTVTLKVPHLTPGFDPNWRVSFSAGTVLESRGEVEYAWLD